MRRRAERLERSGYMRVCLRNVQEHFSLTSSANA
jgi:hypothetical protein